MTTTTMKLRGNKCVIEDMIHISKNKYVTICVYDSGSLGRNGHTGLIIPPSEKRCRVCHKRVTRSRLCRACYECKSNKYFARYNVSLLYPD